MVAVGVFFRLGGFFRGLHGFREGRFPPIRPAVPPGSIFSAASLRFRSADGSIDCARPTLRCTTSTNPKGTRTAVRMANHRTACPEGLLLLLIIFPPLYLFGICVQYGSEEMHCYEDMRSTMFLSHFQYRYSSRYILFRFCNHFSN
jgi:hypothetical protein